MTKKVSVFYDRRLRRAIDDEKPFFQQYPTIIRHALMLVCYVEEVGITGIAVEPWFPVICPPNQEVGYLQPTPTQLLDLVSKYEKSTRVEATLFAGLTIANIKVKINFFLPGRVQSPHFSLEGGVNSMGVRFLRRP